jgi:hypothetical protein
MIDRLEHINPDEGRTEPWYAEALPCESCGHPTLKPRIWNDEHQIYVAQDCACNAPSAPTCALLVPALENAVTVREVCRVIREHRRTCRLCRGVVEIIRRKKACREPARGHKEAA